MAEEPSRTRDPGAPPIPDPTLLTTEALHREIEHLRQFLEAAIDQADRRYEERYQSQMQALNAARESADRSVTKAEEAASKRADEVSRRVDDVKDLTATQIAAIQTQLAAMSGRVSGGVAMWGILAGAVLLVASIITTVLALTT
jgi:hypothetical protein